MNARTGRSAAQGDVAHTQPSHRSRTSDRSRTSGLLEAAGRQQVVGRVTVALIPDVSEDLQRLQDLTTLSKTDIVNRAITLYEFIEAQLRAGNDILIRDKKTRETQSVVIL